jgi:large subunit ribosomal protein L35
MPKLKTRKAAAKRIKVTGSGKFTRRRTFRAHLLEHKSPSRKRRLTGTMDVHETDQERVRLMMPYA